MKMIPKLDLSHFTNGSKEQREEFVNALGQAYEEIGFVAVRNHGISSDHLIALYKNVESFFKLPQEIKNQYDDTEGGGQRGYTGFGRSTQKIEMRVI